jgi:SepF-like predicted cell division protein (DUF552 family)
MANATQVEQPAVTKIVVDEAVASPFSPYYIRKWHLKQAEEILNVKNQFVAGVNPLAADTAKQQADRKELLLRSGVRRTRSVSRYRPPAPTMQKWLDRIDTQEQSP